MIRVIVVHQAKLIANIIASVLSEEPDIYVVGTAVTAEEALGKLELSNCNMVLTAANLPDGGSLTLTETVAASFPGTKVLIIGVAKSESAILQYVMAGASGYVLQDVPVEHLLDNVRAVHQDEALVSPDIAAALMHQIAQLAQVSAQHSLDPQAVADLTARERDVLNLISEGLTNQEIAERLVIEVGTVKNHVHNVLKKLGVSSRGEAASYLPLLEEKDS
jgi:DNA-binding NarL/FixJ family response regulator